MGIKSIKLIGFLTSFLASAMLIYSFFSSFFDPEMIAFMDSHGVGSWRIHIGIGELVSTIIFLLPKTSKYGLLLLSSYMGGAIVLHMSHSEDFIMESIILVFIWIGGMFRNYEYYFKKS